MTEQQSIIAMRKAGYRETWNTLMRQAEQVFYEASGRTLTREEGLEIDRIKQELRRIEVDRVCSGRNLMNADV